MFVLVPMGPPFMAPPAPPLRAVMGPFMIPPGPPRPVVRPFMVPLAPRSRSVLNPYAKPFSPEPYADQRCLFLTFSNGFPLTENQIFTFFNRMYPFFVEDVYVHRTRSEGGEVKPSLFGKVMFKLTLVTDLVLGNHEKVCFHVEGAPLFCRRFVDQRNRDAEAASSSNHGGGD